MRALALVIATALLFGCQVPAPAAPATPTGVVGSVFKVETAVGSGTGWVVYSNARVSFVVTAGHVCDARMVAGDLGLPLDVVLEASDGSKYPTTFHRRDPVNDLCLLVSSGWLGPALEVSPRAPAYDEPVFYVGAPLGDWGDGIAPVMRGSYIGGDQFSAPVAGGASGSALMTSSGVIGVVVAVANGFDHLAIMETREHLIAFLTAAGL